ncbi:MAG: hypothetical protein Q8N71_02595, partial [candidate division Zixibacteria bacterium]|nr:hypothetical protein [candidate division Zixibacteria bacterium]
LKKTPLITPKEKFLLKYLSCKLDSIRGNDIFENPYCQGLVERSLKTRFAGLGAQPTSAKRILVGRAPCPTTRYHFFRDIVQSF